MSGWFSCWRDPGKNHACPASMVLCSSHGSHLLVAGALGVQIPAETFSHPGLIWKLFVGPAHLVRCGCTANMSQTRFPPWSLDALPPSKPCEERTVPKAGRPGFPDGHLPCFKGTDGSISVQLTANNSGPQVGAIERQACQMQGLAPVLSFLLFLISVFYFSFLPPFGVHCRGPSPLLR